MHRYLIATDEWKPTRPDQRITFEGQVGQRDCFLFADKPPSSTRVQGGNNALPVTETDFTRRLKWKERMVLCLPPSPGLTNR